MNILKLFESFQNQEQAIEYLERIRWSGRPVCPYCDSESVGAHASGDRANHRWQCRQCARAFAVTVGTIFHGTHVPLRNWFLVVALMLNAKESASAYQIARDLGMRRPTVWSMMHRVRVAMETDQNQSDLLHGIVGADDSSIRGKPRGPKINPESRGKGRKRPSRRTIKTAMISIPEFGRTIFDKLINPATTPVIVLGKYSETMVEAAA